MKQVLPCKSITGDEITLLNRSTMKPTCSVRVIVVDLQRKQTKKLLALLEPTCTPTLSCLPLTLQLPYERKRSRGCFSCESVQLSGGTNLGEN